jgi:hypothetical protein
MQPSTGADDPDEDVHRDVIEAPIAESEQRWGRDEAQSVEAESRPAGSMHRDETPGEGPPAEVVDGDVVQEMDVQQVVDGEEAPSGAEEPKRGRGTRKRAAQPRAAKKTDGAAPRARKTAAKSPRAPRARKTSE